MRGRAAWVTLEGDTVSLLVGLSLMVDGGCARRVVFAYMCLFMVVVVVSVDGKI